MADNNSLKTILDPKIIRLVRPYSRRVILAIVFSLIASGASGGIAWLLKPIVDSIFVEKKYTLLTFLPFIVIGLYALQGGCQLIYSYLIRTAGFQLVRDTRYRLYEHLHRLPVASLGKESAGKVISRFLNDTTQVQKMVSQIMLTVFKHLPTIFVLLGVAFYRRWDVTLISLVVLPGIALYSHRQGKRVKKKRNRAQQQLATLTHIINETISGIKVIKSFLNEPGLTRRFNQLIFAQYRQEAKIILHKELAKFVANLSTGVGIGLVIWYGGSLVVSGVITSGDLFSALGAMVMVFSPVKEISKSYALFQEITAATERLWWLEQLEIEKSGENPLPEFRKEIRYENVSHSYDQENKNVLHNINLTIRKGETVAFVGPSGAGKTTMIDLLPRFFDPGQGRIVVDDLDITEVKLADLRNLIGLVSQDVILFNDTVRANIAFGSHEVRVEEIEKASRLANAHEFIQQFPDGYETVLGEGGVSLSGGQRQRIAIARAILKNAPILILDEATSALDSTSEILVQHALEDLMGNKTTIVVAHRLSTIRNADRIIVLDRGRILAQGSHKELLEKSALYRELYSSFNNDSI
ncbi:MAG: ABC transporter ATP-binding protein [Thermodesulfobacteriota bacterium]